MAFGSRSGTSSWSCLWAARLSGQSFCWDTLGKQQCLKSLGRAYLIVLSFSASHHWKMVGRLGILPSFAKFCTLVCTDESHHGPLLSEQFLGTPHRCYYSGLHVMTPHQWHLCMYNFWSYAKWNKKSWHALSCIKLSKVHGFPAFSLQHFADSLLPANSLHLVYILVHVCEHVYIYICMIQLEHHINSFSVWGLDNVKLNFCAIWIFYLLLKLNSISWENQHIWILWDFSTIHVCWGPYCSL